MNLIPFDLLLAAVVVIATLRGKKRGLVLTLCGFLTLFVAFLGAWIVSALLTEPVAALLEPLVEQAVLTILSNQVMADPPTAATEFSLRAVLGTLGTVPFFAGLAEMFRSALEAGAVEVVGSAAVAVAQFAAVQLARILLFILSFAAIVVAWWILSHTLDLAFHLPGLNFLNRTGGLLFGFAQGITLVFILCWLLRDSYITPEMVEHSFFLPWIYHTNPLLYISALHS